MTGHVTMPLRSTEAFVLDTAALRERDKLVTLFTEAEGKVRGVAHGAARSVRRFGGRLERLSRVRATYFEKEGADLVRLEDLELLEETFRLHGDLRISAALSYICEITNEFAREKESDRRYFRLLGATVDGFRRGTDARILLRYFEVWTARLHGIFPGFESCDLCSRPFGAGGALMEADGGAALCKRCSRPSGSRLLRVSPAALTLLDGFRRVAPASLASVHYPRAAIRQVEEAAAAALVSFTGRGFRSREFLKQVMGENGQ